MRRSLLRSTTEGVEGGRRRQWREGGRRSVREEVEREGVRGRGREAEI
jgi:hypothetical protein